jgi:MFS family permease
MHLSALAVGSAIGGLAAGRVLWWRGRRAVLWGGGAGMSLGGILLATPISAVITISGTFLIGLGGVLVMIVGQAGLSDHHGRNRAVALAEGSLASSLLASFAPLMVGGFESAGIGWRGALISIIGGWGMIAICAWRMPVPAGNHTRFPTAQHADSTPREKLPSLFWAYWVLLMILVAVHWSIGLWSAEYFQSVVGLGNDCFPLA